MLLAALVITSCSSEPEGWVPAQMDTLGVEIPPGLAGFCRRGTRWNPAPENARPVQHVPDPPGERIGPVENVYADNHSGLPGPLRCVIRTEAEWRAFWVAAAGGTLKPSLPAVNFGRQMVLAAVMEPQGSTGYAIGITSASAVDDSVIAVVRQTSPGAGCTVGALVTTPLHVARIPRTKRPVRFSEWIAVVPPC